MCVTSCLLPRSPCALGPRRQAWPPSPQKSRVGLREVGLIERQVCGMIVGEGRERPDAGVGDSALGPGDRPSLAEPTGMGKEAYKGLAPPRAGLGACQG